MSFSHRSFPRAILHVDGDAFFAGCEVAQDASLRGKPVVVGKEKGMVIAVTYEAKALGVTRGMLISEAQKVCPGLVVKTSNYELYGLYSNRMHTIVRRYTPDVEEYSVDECFADLTGLRSHFHMPYGAIARKIKDELEADLGMTFSVGLGPTKVIAKVASKWRKPNGFTVIPAKEIEDFLRDVPVGKVWGIGPNTSAYLQKFSIKTALQFAERPEVWVMETLSKPYQELWHEMRGTAVHSVNPNYHTEQKSIMKTRTFRPSSTDKSYVLSELSKNVERVSVKLRAHGYFAKEISAYLKTQEFTYKGFEVRLPVASSTPTEILKALLPQFEKAWRPNTPYRATGVIARSLRRGNDVQHDLFGKSIEQTYTVDMFASIDALANKYKNKHLVFLASSLKALRSKKPKTNAQRKKLQITHLTIPYWGETS